MPVVQRLKRGDRQALSTVYGWYGERLYRRAILPTLPVPELAEDVLKDTFRIAMERIDQYQPQGQSIFFWLRRIAINRAIDVQRSYQSQRRLQDRIEQEPDHVFASRMPSPDRSTEVAETSGQVHKVLDDLNPRYAEALRMRLLEDRDREDCAEALGVTISTFDVLFHRACKAFKKAWAT